MIVSEKLCITACSRWPQFSRFDAWTEIRLHVRLPLASNDAHAGFLMGRNLGVEELPDPMILRQQAAHRRQQQMAMPTGPLVVLSPAYVVPYETTFFLREKVFSIRDSFDVRDASGQCAFQLRGALVSMRERKVLCDRNGQPVATLTNRLLSIRDAVEIHSADGRMVLAEVRKQLISLTHGARISVTGLQFPLEVHGDFRGRNFEIRHGNQIAARVMRRTLMNVVSGRDHYTLTVSPHVDTAFMVALAMVFDAMFD